MSQTTSPPGENSQRLWRSLAELHEDPAVLEAAHREFPVLASVWEDVPSRRAFLHRMGASLALAGLTGCVQQPDEQIVPAVEAPEHLVPGVPQVFATSMPTPGGAMGLLVTAHDGRPTKIEGNPEHPSSLGATDLFAQAEILNLYDPDRSQVVQRRGEISSWADFLQQVTPRIEAHRREQGAGLHVLLGNRTSPTLLSQLQQLLEELPEARWYEDEPLLARGGRVASQQVFGQELDAAYRLDQADVILSVDSDFLVRGPGCVRLAREFSRRRRVPGSGRGNMNRLYAVESTPTLTGAAADHRLGLPPRQVKGMLAAIAGAIGVSGAATASLTAEHQEWAAIAAEDLQRAGERALVVVGPEQPADVHALAYRINSQLGSIGRTVTFHEPVDRLDGQTPGTLADLAAALDESRVGTLLILGANPVYTAPSSIGFAEKLKEVSLTIHQGLFIDETARVCNWHIPATHFLESWSDARAENGVASIIQPLIAPLHNGQSEHSLLNLLLGQPGVSDYDTVRGYWEEQLGGDDFDRVWGKSLHDGVIAGTQREPVAVEASGGESAPSGDDASGTGEYQLVFRADPTVLDGRYANNAWLQELPKPFTAQVWGNAAWVSPALPFEDGDVVEIRSGDRSIQIPVVKVPGQPQEVVTLHLGHGRRFEGRNASGTGTDVTPLLPSAGFAAAGDLTPTGDRIKLVTTQNHFRMEGREIVRRMVWDQETQQFERIYEREDHHGHEAPKGEALPTLYPDWKKEGVQWGMSINLSACTGCNACVIACQSENNIPVVGPEQVEAGREMHWMRVDTYFTGDEHSPEVHHQPMLCQHCEHAPCEVVCPVAATTHSEDGLNEMTYNRCVGTRYCSNNCPYKVRRFNFLDYRESLKELPIVQLQQNPNVTVRSRGVMEKCTYCVQRIRKAGIDAQVNGRELQDGDVVTACQAVCPSEAIVFGDIMDKSSAVSRAKAHSLEYGVLEEINTRPRTTYTAEVRNPNPRLRPAAHEGAAHHGGHA